MESYKVKPGYVLREIAQEYLAVPIGTGGEIVILNPVSKLLWERLQAPQTLDELTDAVTEQYDVDAAQAREDILAFLNNLKSSNLLAEIE